MLTLSASKLAKLCPVNEGQEVVLLCYKASCELAVFTCLLLSNEKRKIYLKFSISLNYTRMLVLKSIATLRNKAAVMRVEHSSEVTVPRNALLNEYGVAYSELFKRHTNNHDYSKNCNNSTVYSNKLKNLHLQLYYVMLCNTVPVANAPGCTAA